MDIVDIYGNISDKSELIMGVGNYNNIHGLLTYFPHDNLLQMRPLPEIITPSVIRVELTYENFVPRMNKVFFSLSVKDELYSEKKYINVTIETDENRKIAVACISEEKSIFWIDYSCIDKTPRSELLAGALYSLKTKINGEDNVVYWRIKGFSNGDLVIFLPTTWYEKDRDDLLCQKKNGIITLVESLNQLGFKGYTTQQWCENVSNVIHCIENTQCGECLGQCQNPDHICYPNINKPKQFICGPPNMEPNLNQLTTISFSETSSTTINGTVWIVIIIIIVLLILGLLYINNLK